jgi:hypothetical protein
MTILPRGTAGPQPEEANSRGAGCRGNGAPGLKRDEWEFLRATPDYDAEEMASVALATTAFPPAESVGMDDEPGRGLGSQTEFPEAETLVSMLGDLLQPQQGPGGGTPGADPVWSDVPAANEWAELMSPEGGVGPRGADGRPSGVPAAGPPPSRDVLLDALAAGERAGLLPNRAPRER